MVKTHEMELDGMDNHTEMNLAFSEITSQKSKKENKVIKMIYMFQQVLHEVIQWQGHENVDEETKKRSY